MRAEMLKRLDEFVNRTIARSEGEYDFDQERAEWAAIRVELKAERCENCERRGNVGQCRYISDSASDALAWPECTCEESSVAVTVMFLTQPDFCCSHFSRKPKEPTGQSG